MNFRIPACVALVLFATGCAQTVDNAAVATAAGPATQGAAHGSSTLVVFSPCMDTTIKIPDWMKGHPGIVIDGKVSSNITVCEHRKLSLSAGRHAVRIADPFIDLAAIAGNGKVFQFDAGKTHYLKLISHRSGVSELTEVDSERGVAEVSAIDKIAR